MPVPAVASSSLGTAEQIHRLHAAAPAAVSTAATSWTVRPHQSLSVIARKVYGHAADWPVLFWANHHAIRWADQVPAGISLRVPPLPHRIPAPPRHTSPPAPRIVLDSSSSSSVPGSAPPRPVGTRFSFAGLEQLWESAGGPSYAAAGAATVAECESGGNSQAYNPSGATGVWQILGSVVAGNLYDPYVNALNAVSKWRASGGSFAQWVCTP